MKTLTKTRPLPTISTSNIVFGCDPEFFFARDGKIIGSEKIIPKEGMNYKPRSDSKRDGSDTVKSDSPPESKIVIDGVQAELNPRPNTCRANLANEISCCFRTLYNQIKDDKTLKVDFSQTIKIDKEELMTLDEKSRTFGCAPSKNAYNKENKISVRDATTYPYRSAGGHIHIGIQSHQHELKEIVAKNPERLARMYDIIVGNTCVLIDRDPGNKERRKVYGKAGEFRLPKHGIEYRTPSNFWLRNYALFSLVTGLMRFATSVIESTTKEKDYEAAFLKRVNMARITKAINNNDLVLARRNFRRISKVIAEIANNWGSHPLCKDNMHLFEHFAKKGLDYWFKEDPLTHWINLPEGHERGWERYLDTVVKADYEKSKKK